MLELAVVVPTFNEAENVKPLLGLLSTALAGIEYEVVFVDDDSTDDTAGLVRSIAERDPRVRIVHRIHRSGLSSATIEGMMASGAPYLAVMDADLQHDERILRKMFDLLRSSELDLVIGSRNVEGGGMGEFAARRVTLSNAGRRLSRLICHAELSDPMSGFFVLRRSFLNEVVRSLSGHGFKILLDLVASSARPVRFAEVAYTFRRRLHGKSKLDILVGVEYLELLLDKLVGNWIPVSYLLFGVVGSIGVVLHLAAVLLLIRLAGLTFFSAQMVSSSLVIASNFLLNNYLTFRSSRLRGVKLIKGMILFYIGSGIGLAINASLSQLLRNNGLRWYAASVAGLIAGSVWNYWISLLFVWQVNRRRARHYAERSRSAAAGTIVENPEARSASS
jgi:dolichol-phosphate mannosyltransferase